MRRICTMADLRWLGVKRAARERDWRRAAQGVYAEGREPVSALDRARAVVVATGGVASGRLAGVLYVMDGVTLAGPEVTVPPGSSNTRYRVRRRRLPREAMVRIAGVWCTNPLVTLWDLAAELDDDHWEQALEYSLRKRLVALSDVGGLTDARGAARVRRVLALRPAGAPPTGSLLETLMVQLARTVPGLPPPERQVEVRNRHGDFVAFVDLAWRQPGVFVELDGQQHADQPVYDARRQTAVSAATGWLCGRFTWHEVVHLPTTTARNLAALVEQARLSTG
jgi:hypothetical protein